MARIRSVKPQLRTSLTVAEWPREVRYFWVLLWGYLDDHGAGVDDARLIKADCFPLDDDLTRAEVEKWLVMMAQPSPHEDEPTICRYEAKGRRYLHAPKWSDHQKPQHPKDSEIPPCPFHGPGRPSGDLHEGFMKSSGELQEDQLGVFGASGTTRKRASGGLIDGKSNNASDPPKTRSEAEDPQVTGFMKSSRSSHEDLTPEVEVERELLKRETRASRASPTPPSGTSKRSASRKSAATDSARDRRIPDDFAVTVHMRQWAAERCPGIDIAIQTEKFINHWLAAVGKNAIKRDWNAAWRNWMLRAVEYAIANAPRQQPEMTPAYHQRIIPIPMPIEDI